MEAVSDPLIISLREARLAKGWSQRELSQRAGLPQAHISRIESGSVDLKLSTLRELARLLDLELVLAPRAALTAVNAVVREIVAESGARTVRGVATVLAQAARRLAKSFPREPAVVRLPGLADDLVQLEPLIQSKAQLADLEARAEAIEVAARNADLAALARHVDRLTDFRNHMVHQRPETERPAYALDDVD